MRHTRVGLGLTTALAVSLAPLATGPLSISVVDTAAHITPRGHAAAEVSAAPLQAAMARTLHVRGRLDDGTLAATDGTTPYPPPQKIAPRTVIEGRIMPGDHRKVRIGGPRGGPVWTASALLDHDLPAAALKAYKNAAAMENQADPSCRIPWTLLAGIGRVESNHGRYGGSVLGSDGIARPTILGPELNGAGPVAAIRDTDNGRWDGDKVWDRAVGPMQFIPSTWAYAGRDGDGDGIKSPNDINDAALAAAGYLCAGGTVGTDAGMRAAIFRYNPSDYYVSLVMAFERGYQTGVFVIPSPPAPDLAAQQAKQDAKKAKALAKKAKQAKQKAKAKQAAAKKAAKVKAAKAKATTTAKAGAKVVSAPSTSTAPSSPAKAPTKTPTKTPASSSPKPSQSPSSTDTPSPSTTPSSSDTPSPSTTPSSTDSPSASTSPQTTQLNGTLALSADGTIWTVGDTVVTVPADFPDMATLKGLVGQTVTLEVEQDTMVVQRIVSP